LTVRIYGYFGAFWAVLTAKNKAKQSQFVRIACSYGVRRKASLRWLTDCVMRPSWESLRTAKRNLKKQSQC